MTSTVSSRNDEPVGVAIVDDDLRYAEALAELLQLGSEIEVVGIATSVAEGIRLLASPRVQLGLVDVNMPDGGGLRVVEAVREWANGPTLAFISSEDQSAIGLAAGVEFIPKVRIDEHHLIGMVKGPSLQ